MSTSARLDWDAFYERLRTVFPEPQAEALADVLMLLILPSWRTARQPTAPISEEPDSGGKSDEQSAEENRSDSHF